ncbi:MAG TPA: two-component system sensor histidine kinase CreC [Planctomycetota bacterium]|nr:two-component system sensor histidine kinase CreC [Planctomycetota bacterium]
MSIRLRIFLTFFLTGAAGLWLLASWTRDEVRRYYLISMEESLIDTANVLAAMLAGRLQDGQPDSGELRRAFQGVQREAFTARIYDLTKTRVDLRVYVTDRRGIVVFDSDGGRAEGQDYSRWRDVALTLHGSYGARTTRSDPDDPRTSVHCVAAPVRVGGEVVGALSVCKPPELIYTFIDSAQRKVLLAALVAGAALLVLSYAIALWVTQPIERLTAYARAVRDGRRAELPRLDRSEIGAMGAAFDQMREALEGRRYAEQFVQTLTHEIKSPLSAIRGAAELLGEELPPERRARFAESVRAESERIRQVVDRLLELASLESRRGLRDVEEVDLGSLAGEVAGAHAGLAEARGLHIAVEAAGPAVVRGERFLLRQAMANLIQNAADFSPRGGTIAVAVASEAGGVRVTVVDSGPGIPDFARERVFEKFYSLPRPDTGRKSTGLGLALVRQVAELHGGTARIDNRPEGGARATLILPDGSAPGR